jgi:hypothetical protein
MQIFAVPEGVIELVAPKLARATADCQPPLQGKSMSSMPKA